MRFLVWNCRGMGNSRAIRELGSLNRVTSPLVIGLIETKMVVKKLEAVRIKLGCEGCFGVPARRSSGGLAILWKRGVNLSIISYSNYHIDFLVDDMSSIRYTLFYGSPVAHKRRYSWNLLKRLSVDKSKPWCVFGDFNDILCRNETTRFSYLKFVSMNLFQKAVQECSLFDIGYKGHMYTYTNKRLGQNECKSRLDRVLATNDWINLFSDAVNLHIVTCTSDHMALLLSLKKENAVKNLQFRFENMWLMEDGFKEVMRKEWKQIANHNCALETKLSCLKDHLSRWNMKVFGNVQAHIRNAREKLLRLRLKDRDEEVQQQEEEINKEIDEWLRREELLWKQRSKIIWLEEGDDNTKFFHSFANNRRRKNFIESIQDCSGRMVMDQHQIKEIVADYFKHLFMNRRSLSYDQIQHNIACVQRRVTRAHNDFLTAPYSAVEVKRALFQMNPWKAPGVDGFNAAFFQQCWEDVKDDVVKDCLQFLNEGRINLEANVTMITLIPKINKPEKVAEYRPISLVGIKMRIISKMIVNRLQQIIAYLISPEQSAFVPNRLITDNLIVSHELFHFIRSMQGSRKKVYASLKIDIAKAYDTIDWDFLEAILYKLGFADVWISRVMQIVTSVTYIIKVNNEYTDVIYPKRGIRQGDPISPYLYILCTEYFSALMGRYRQCGLLEGVKICRRADPVSYLLFADDSLIFCRVTKDSIMMIKKLLEEFAITTGLHINSSKSEIMLSRNVTSEITTMVKAVLGVRIVQNHAKYLGLPTVVQRKCVQQFQSIVDKLRKKTENWKVVLLSKGGKQVLVKSILNAIPQYWLSCFLLPTTIIKQLHSIINSFWWSCGAKTKRIHWTKAAILVKPKEEGGLGFCDFKHLNRAFLAKQCWRIIKNEGSLMARLLRAKYFNGGNLFDAPKRQDGSHFWKALYSVLSLVKAGSCQEEDGIRWRKSSMGNLDIKSAYLVSKELFERENGDTGQGSDDSKLRRMWRGLWRLQLPRKIKIFVWRMYHAALPTGNQKWRRGLMEGIDCSICGYHFEEDVHPFISCWWSRALWRELDFLVIEELDGCNQMADVLFKVFYDYSLENFSLFCTAVWYLWFHRNMVFHGSECMSPIDVASRIKRLHADFTTKRVHWSSNISVNLLAWTKPSRGYIKINCDAAWSGENREAGIAAIAKDDGGVILGVVLKFRGQCDSVAVAEGMALYEGMKMAKRKNWDKVIFETDCTTIVEGLNWKKNLQLEKNVWFQDMLESLEKFQLWRVFFVRREANSMADSLAKWVKLYRLEWSRLDALPVCLSMVQS